MIAIIISTNVNKSSYVTYIKAPPLSQDSETDGFALPVVWVNILLFINVPDFGTLTFALYLI